MIVAPKFCISIVFSFSWELKWPQETENNAYAKFWGDKQRTLWYVMVFLEWSIGRMTCHCFLRPIRRDLTSSSYTTLFFRLGRLESNFARFIQNCMYKSLFKRVNWIFGLNIHCCLVDCCQSRVVANEKVFHNRWQLS